MVLIAAVLVWLVAGWFSPGAGVDAVRIDRARIGQYVDERASTRLPRTYLITAPSAGRVEAVSAVEGQRVKKGETVARFVPIDLDLAVREAEAAIERLKAAIHESGDTGVEETGLKQVREYVKSTEKTVAANAKRIESARAQRDYAVDEWKRVEDLFQKRVRTKEDLDRARTQKIQAEADYEQTVLSDAAMTFLKLATDWTPELVERYITRKGLGKTVLERQLAEATVRLEQVKLQQSRGTMTSPVDGVVLHRFVTSEGFLSAGTQLLEIGRLEDLEVEADILSVDMPHVKKGYRAEIYGPAIGPKSAWGSVERLYPAGFTKISSLGVEQQRVKVIVWLDRAELSRLQKERGLGAGYRVRVRIHAPPKDNALVVPRSALFRGPNRVWQLYVVRGGRARIQDVELGILNDEFAEVTKGIADGELVVPSPESTLADGQRVSPVLRQQPRIAATTVSETARGNGE